jgi:YVTN family beta-propeller protein
MKVRALLLMVFLAVTITFTAAFFGCGQQPQQEGNTTNGGFPLKSINALVTSTGGIITTTNWAGATISGQYLNDAESDAVGSSSPFAYSTDEYGNAFATNRRIFANWSTQVNWGTPCGGPDGPLTQSSTAFNVSPYTGIEWVCEDEVTVEEAAALSPQFVLSGSLPTSLTVSASGFSNSGYGMPTLTASLGTWAEPDVSASSVAGDGSSATFPFPSSTYGALGAGLYGVTVNNKTASGPLTDATGYFVVGSSDTTQTTPYGVTAFDNPHWYSSCVDDSWYGTSCSGAYWSSADYAVTLATPGKVCMDGSCASVGTEPVDVKTYGSGTEQDWYQDDGCEDVGSGEEDCYYEQGGVTPPAYAIVTNFGDNTADIVNLSNMSVAATISVGTNPTSVVLDASQTNAYVANYGSSSITEINLSSKAVVRTISVGSAPSTLSLDPSGNSLWVAGLNYISNISLSSYTVTSTNSVSGQVTSLVVSGGQNSWVFTSVSSDLSTFQSQDVAISSPTTFHSDAELATAGTPYSGSGTTTTPPPYLKASAVVSANYGNDIAITSTPTGFAVIDLGAHAVILQGTTPSAVRGIATDPAQGVAYLTAPESNSLITVPLPVQD